MSNQYNNRVTIMVKQFISCKKRQIDKQNYELSNIINQLFMDESNQTSTNINEKQNSIHLSIASEIQAGSLSVPNTEQPLLRDKKQKHQSMMDKISRMKNKTLENLYEIEIQEQQLLLKIRKSKSPKKKSPERSNFTESQKESIKEILKHKNKQETKNKEKHKKIMESFLYKLKQEKQKQRQSIEEARKKHQQIAQKNLKDLKVKKSNRQLLNKQIQERVKEVKKRKYLFQIKKEDVDESNKLRQENQREQKLKKIHEEHMLDNQEIFEHAKDHNKYLKEKQVQRKQRLKTEYASHQQKYFQTNISRQLIAQEEEKRQSQQQLKSKPFLYRNKVKQFDSFVRKNYKPAVSRKEQKKLIQSQKKGLSYMEAVNQGNQYLKYAKKHRKQKDDSRVLTQPKIERYENYLLQIKKRSKRYDTLEKFRTIIDSDRTKDYQTVAKATQLAQEIDAKSKKKKDQKMYDSIKNKLDILNVLL